MAQNPTDRKPVDFTESVNECGPCDKDYQWLEVQQARERGLTFSAPDAEMIERPASGKSTKAQGPKGPKK
jgi:hypothetical protein